MKTSELTGAALDLAVAKCEGKGDDCEVHAGNVLYGRVTSGFVHYNPSTNWAQGGPIIEREFMSSEYSGVWRYFATCGGVNFMGVGPTPLIAAMRCLVASKLGDEVEIPEELL